VAACGARTGLSFEVELDGGSDAGQDVSRADSGPGDVAVEAPVDAAFDVPIDVTDGATIDAPADVPPDTALDAPIDSLPVDAADACDGACACPPGTMPVGSSCLPIVGAIPSPRPLAPLSTARVTSGTALLKWELPAGTDGAVVECCADRACTQITETFLAPGKSGAPPAPLPSGVSFWRLLGTSSGSVGSTPGPTWEVFVPIAPSPKARTWWGSTLDLNGDGLADVGATALALNSYSGAAYVYTSQRGAGPSSTPLEVDGPDPGDEYGCTIDSAGDVNGDGFGDLVVGQCDLDLSGAGADTYVYLGGPSGISPVPMRLGAGGYAASTAGDVNSDGYGDLVVGELGGVGSLFLGGPSGIGATQVPLGGTPPGGSSAFASADVNGDGWQDLIVGASEVNGRQGAVVIYLGTPAGLSTTPLPLLGPPAGATAGFGSEIGVSDLDGDGYADVFIGAYLINGGAGEGYLYMGSPGGLVSPPLVFDNPNGGSPGRYTIGLSGVHDVNGDGFDDFVVGSFLAAGDVGAAWLYLGGSSGLSKPVPLENPNLVSNAYFGMGIAGGDADGDGYADVLVGSQGIGGSVGAAYVYRGSPSGLQTPIPLVNPHPMSMGYFGLNVGM
jgi:hypothetical protein